MEARSLNLNVVESALFRILQRNRDTFPETVFLKAFLTARFLPLNVGMLQPGNRLHWDITERILGVFHEVHYEIGDGFLESICEAAMVIALREAGLEVTQDARFTVTFRGQEIGRFIPDMIVNGVVLVEIKSCREIEPRHKAQTINYLRVSPLEVALLLNFGPKPQFDRLILTNDRKQTATKTE